MCVCVYLEQSVERWLPGTEGWGKWANIGQRIQIFSYAGLINSGVLMYSVVTIVNNTALYI